MAETPHRFTIAADHILDPHCEHPIGANCACVRCDACNGAFLIGDDVYQRSIPLYPYRSETHPEQMPVVLTWHVRCDERGVTEVGALGAEGRPGMRHGAVVTVSGTAHKWDDELCDVEREFLWKGKLHLYVASVFTPSQVATILSTRARLVAPPVPPKEVRGDA